MAVREGETRNRVMDDIGNKSHPRGGFLFAEKSKILGSLGETAKEKRRGENLTQPKAHGGR